MKGDRARAHALLLHAARLGVVLRGSLALGRLWSKHRSTSLPYNDGLLRTCLLVEFKCRCLPECLQLYDTFYQAMRPLISTVRLQCP
jgi:hypothetical protein